MRMTPMASILVLLGSGSALIFDQPAARAMAFQCFDRSSGEKVAESHIDISSAEVRCRADDDGGKGLPSSPSDPFAAKRALNLARGTAVALNGGLSSYRPSSCMFQTAASNPCITRTDSSGIEFTIPGGEPGWEESGNEPTVLTVVTITPDGRTVIETNQN